MSTYVAHFPVYEYDMSSDILLNHLMTPFNDDITSRMNCVSILKNWKKYIHKMGCFLKCLNPNYACM